MKKKLNVKIIGGVLATAVIATPLVVFSTIDQKATKPDTKDGKAEGIFSVKNGKLLGLTNSATEADVRNATINHKLVLPSDVISIGENALNPEVDTRLKAIAPNTVAEIDISTVQEIAPFAYYKSNITGVTFTQSIEGTKVLGTIGKCAFAKSGITSIKIPSCVHTIGASAFDGCTSITTIDITEVSSTITYGNRNVFPKLESATCIKMSDPSKEETQDIWSDLIIHGLSPKIPQADANGDTYATQYKPITGPLLSFTKAQDTETNETVLTITGVNSKYSISDFTMIKIPSTINNFKVTKVNSYVFQNQTNIFGLRLSENLKEIGEYAFSGCTLLGTNQIGVQLPSTLKKIGEHAFDSCSNLISFDSGITFADGNRRWKFGSNNYEWLPSHHTNYENAYEIINHNNAWEYQTDDAAYSTLQVYTSIPTSTTSPTTTKTLKPGQKVQLIASNTNGYTLGGDEIEWTTTSSYGKVIKEDNDYYFLVLNAGSTTTAKTATVTCKTKKASTTVTKTVTINIAHNDSTVLSDQKELTYVQGTYNGQTMEAKYPVGMFAEVTTTVTPNLENPNTQLKYSTDFGKTWQDATSGTGISVSAGSNVYFIANEWSKVDGETKYINSFTFNNSSGSSYGIHLNGHLNSLNDNGADTYNICPQESAFENCFRVGDPDETSTSVYSAIKTVSKTFIPYPTLSKNCLKFAFLNCRKATQIPDVQASTISEGSCYGTFKNCNANTGTIWIKPEEIPVDGIRDMYVANTSATKAFVFAKEIQAGGAWGLLAGCSLINTIYLPNMVTWPTADGALYEWLNDVGLSTTASTRKFYKNTSLSKPSSASTSTINSYFYNYINADAGTQDMIEKPNLLSVYSDSSFYFHQWCRTASEARDLYYSTDGGNTWTQVTYNEGITFPAYTNVYLKSDNKTKGFSTIQGDYDVNDTYANMLYFAGDAKTNNANLYLNGSIRSLLDNGDPTAEVSFPAACFSRLFREAYITNISKNLFKGVETSKYGFHYMFDRLSGLTKLTPDLFADMSLSVNCYHSMFINSSIEEIPANFLPSTTTIEGCYNEMFWQCKSLKTIPSHLLPAREAAGWAYRYMFKYCPSLTYVPTDLIDCEIIGKQSCEDMFAGDWDSKTQNNIYSLPAFKIKKVTGPEALYGAFWYCPNITFMKINFQEWLTYDDVSVTTGWLDSYNGLYNPVGIAFIDPQLPTTERTTGTIPSTWTIVKNS